MILPPSFILTLYSLSIDMPHDRVYDEISKSLPIAVAYM